MSRQWSKHLGRQVECTRKSLMGPSNPMRQMLEPKYPMSLRARRRCFRGLVKICGEYSILPSSCIIPESRIQKLGDSPVWSSDFSDVWPGIYNEDDEKDEDEGKSVAIKVIRCWQSDDFEAIKKVRCFELSSSRSSLTVRRTFSERSSSGSGCLIRTYWS